MESIYVFAFATFGHPNDFRQSCFFPLNLKYDPSIKLFDLTNAIKVSPNSKMYSVRKEKVNGINALSYSIYTFAKEKSSERDGTFIGSSIVFINDVLKENLIIEKLNNFHSELESKNVVADRLIINHSKDFSLSGSAIKDFDKLFFNLEKQEEPIDFNLTNSNLVVYSRTESKILQQNLKKALELLNKYDTIFFTDSRESVEFTKSKGLYKVVDEENGFNNEIQVLRDQKKQQLELIINNFEKELTELEENKKITIRSLKESIEQNSRLHQENARKIEESKKQINDIENKYFEFSKKINEAINFINSNKKIEDVKSFHNENKREFINFINQNIKPTYLSSLNNIQAKTNLTSNHQYNSGKSELFNDKSNNEQSQKKKPFKIFKLISFLFFTLWLSTFIYYQYFQMPKKDEIIENYQNEINQNDTENDVEIKNNIATNLELNPKSNNQLNPNDIKNIAKSIKSDMNISEVVRIIFEKNPTDIKQHYENQIDLYSKKIIELNEDCFEEKDGNNYYKQDTIKNIPSFKSNN